ncbi:hypothetical protein [Candidatus Uabimicrobium sp. HlEnr_7]|uniref:hypothetical protein n=1 Tax=Candidatus Uabimicrobium helgolandensis TaxID=3095367 RepID=UPI0035568C12
MYQQKSAKLSHKILEFVAHNKYLSKTLAIYLFPQYSQSHIEKTLKIVFDNKLLLRKMIENEPIRSGREYVYYLSKKGAQRVLFASEKFADVEEMNVGSGNSNFIYHDLSVAWTAAIWQKQSAEYKGVFFDELTIETRRNFLQNKELIPDLKIVSKKGDNTLKYYIEIDNFTVQSKEWRKRCLYYQSYLTNNTYLLIVLTKYNPKRLNKLIAIASNVISKKNSVFGTSIKEIYHCTYAANVWVGKDNVDLGNNNITMYLPL